MIGMRHFEPKESLSTRSYLSSERFQNVINSDHFGIICWAAEGGKKKKKGGDTILIIFPQQHKSSHHHHIVPYKQETSHYSPPAHYGGHMEAHDAGGEAYGSVEGADTMATPMVTSDGEFASSGQIPVSVPYPVRRMRRPSYPEEAPRYQDPNPNRIRVVNLGGDDMGAPEEDASSSFYKGFSKNGYESTNNQPTILTI